ncbi:hypothetical protein ACNOYE_10425 [Nannocystaceae bacterium ST9]
MSEPRRLDFVADEFSPHNFTLQAVLGLIGFGERITDALAGLPIDEHVRVEPGEHPLDLALLGLLGLHDALLAELDRRGLSPSPSAPEAPRVEPEPPAPEPDALRRLLR